MGIDQAPSAPPETVPFYGSSEDGFGAPSRRAADSLERTPRRLSDLVDIPRLRRMAENLYAAGGIPVGILNVNGDILAGAGWQDICVKYHRVHPVTCEKCRSSDAYINTRLNAQGPVPYKCQNGMWDIAVPILVDGDHLATLFVGQFFYDDEKVDIDFFRKQAEEHGFDRTAYLDALGRVPFFSRERVAHMMTYYQDLVQTLAENGLARVQQERMTDILRDREAQLKSIVTHSPDAIYRCQMDEERPMVFMSEAVCRIAGYPSADFIGNRVRSYPSIIHPEDGPTVRHAVEAAVESRSSFVVVYRIKTATGTIRWVQENGRPVQGMKSKEWIIDGTIRDITERKEAEEALRLSLHEKEVLLKEIHHRVKNNLQVISSLMNLQSSYCQDENMRHVFQDVRDRVRSMALVHENLYQSANLSCIDFSQYLRMLLTELGRAHTNRTSAVRIRTELTEVALTVEMAVPCGLLVNELVTNAFKHAFRGKQDGEVVVTLHETSEGEVTLRVRDNGIGMPTGIDWKQCPSLGLQLVQMLSKQIKATVQVNSSIKGTEFVIAFTPLPQ